MVPRSFRDRPEARDASVLVGLTLLAMLPLFVVTGIFGMNVLFPGEGTTWMFWVILGLMLASLGGMLAILRWKRWI